MPLNILFVDREPNHLEDSGARRRSRLLHESLERYGQVSVLFARDLPIDETTIEELRRYRRVVDVVRFRFPDPPGFLDGLARRFPSRAYALRPLGRDLRRSWIRIPEAASAFDRAVAEGYDLVVCRYLPTAVACGAWRGPASVLDIDDLESARVAELRDSASGPGHRLPAARRVRQAACIERQVLPRFNSLMVCKDADRERILRYGRPAVTAPNVVPLPPNPPAFPNEPALLFVGRLVYKPNHQGLLRFLARVWPQVRSLVPRAALHVVGYGPRAELERALIDAASVGVRYHGPLPEIASAYALASGSIAPIYWGGGTKVKAIEALAYGRPCAAPEPACRGLEPLIGPRRLIRCEDDAAFAEACAEILRGGGHAEEAEARRALVADHFSRARFDAAVDEALASALDGVAPAARVLN